MFGTSYFPPEAVKFKVTLYCGEEVVESHVVRNKTDALNVIKDLLTPDNLSKIRSGEMHLVVE